MKRYQEKKRFYVSIKTYLFEWVAFWLQFLFGVSQE